MNEINILSSLVANQIAAGEVVDRPSSVIKECLENSIDSGATDIVLTLRDSGRECMIIEDNGEGIAKDQLPKTILRHATSKVSTIDDLQRIQTFGFRGEALASISAVSRFRISSCAKGQDHGWVLKQDGEDLESTIIEPSQRKVGTSVEIRDLFYNTPARRRFLKSDRSEWQAIDDVIKRTAMAYSSIKITLKKDAQKPRIYQACSSLKERVAAVIGQPFAEASIHIEDDYKGVKVSGLIGLPTFSRSQGDMQYIFLNERPIKDKAIFSAVRRAYQDVMYQQRFPAYVMFFSLDPKEVDVNVHPSKELVRFADHQGICQLVYKSIKDALAKDRPVDRVEAMTRHDVTQPQSGHHVLPQQSQQFTRQPSLGSSSFSMPPADRQLTSSKVEYSFVQNAKEPLVESSSRQLEAEENIDVAVMNNADQSPTFDMPLGHAIAQVHGIYVLSANALGLVVVDMHAAHERIVYEKLKMHYSTTGIEKQSSLLDSKCELDEHQKACVQLYSGIIDALGFSFRVEGDCAIISATPGMLGRVNTTELFETIVNDLMETDEVQEITLRVQKLLSSMACHSAIRANRSLSLTEMNTLLRSIENTDNSGQCNHGRPTWIQLNQKQMDAWFKRGQ
ncbi:MAG TPA: DNA mismatch repair endonuclease MutL [Gammaproteobacteria bacterium]|nr:DNA mismatch repair endonuclease MutL [Gammaproteobacteria bacterium]